MILDILDAFDPLDAVALAALVSAWVGVSLAIEHPPARYPSVSRLMARYRRDWMIELISRKPRIFDATILASLRQGTTFLASGAMLAVGGVLALAGNAERLDGIVMGIGVEEHPIAFWQAKLIVVAGFLTYAVFKFIWSNRLFGYCAVLMASVPNDITDKRAPRRSAQAAELNIRAALNFNRGLRAIYFAFAAVAWLAGPVALLLAVAIMLWVLLSREFASTSRDVLLED